MRILNAKFSNSVLNEKLIYKKKNTCSLSTQDIHQPSLTFPCPILAEEGGDPQIFQLVSIIALINSLDRQNTHQTKLSLEKTSL